MPKKTEMSLTLVVKASPCIRQEEMDETYARHCTLAWLLEVFTATALKYMEFMMDAQVDFLGLQLVWSTEMAYASPYLLSLGALPRYYISVGGADQADSTDCVFLSI